MKLVKFNADYADEFDVYGFSIMSEEQFALFDKSLSRLQLPYQFYFGTNEFVLFNTESELRDAFSTVDISDEQAQFLLNNLTRYKGSSYYGHFFMVSDYVQDQDWAHEEAVYDEQKDESMEII